MSSYYDWDPVPENVRVRKADVTAKLVKPGMNGGWEMKVPKTPLEGFTHTVISIAEEELQALAIDEFMRGGNRRILTREQLAHKCVMKYHMVLNAEPDWIHEVEVHDDGPAPAVESEGRTSDVDKFRQELARHTDAAHGLLSPAIAAKMIEAYLKPSTTTTHVEHLHCEWGVTPERIQHVRKHREFVADLQKKAHAHHRASIAAAAAEQDEEAEHPLDKARKAVGLKTAKGALS